MTYLVGAELARGMQEHPEIVREALRLHAEREGLVIEDGAKVIIYERTDYLLDPPRTVVFAETLARKAD